MELVFHLREESIWTGFTRGLFSVLKSEGCRICRVSSLTPASAWSSRATRDLSVGKRGDQSTRSSASRLLLTLICRRVFELTLPSVQTVNRPVVWMSCQSSVSLLSFCDIISRGNKMHPTWVFTLDPYSFRGTWVKKDGGCDEKCFSLVSEEMWACSDLMSQDLDWERAGADDKTPTCFRTAVFRFGI